MLIISLFHDVQIDLLFIFSSICIFSVFVLLAPILLKRIKRDCAKSSKLAAKRVKEIKINKVLHALHLKTEIMDLVERPAAFEIAAEHWSKRKLCVADQMMMQKKITKYEISGMTETIQNDSSEIASLNMNGMKTDSWKSRPFQVLSRLSTYKHVLFFRPLYVSIYLAATNIHPAYRTQFRFMKIECGASISRQANIIYCSIMKTLYRHDIRHKSQENYYRLTYSQFATLQWK